MQQLKKHEKDWKDAPLSIQFEEGKRGFQNNEFNPYHSHTMQYREWERGYSSAYFENLERSTP